MGQSVQELLYELNSKRVRKMREEIREQFKASEVDTQDRRDAREAERFGERAKISTVLHLLDLKRAGHSPKQTEYVIPSERASKPRSYPVWGSGVGSPAFSCSES